MDPIKGAVAGAIGGAAGAYTMERFQQWWNDMEKAAAPKRRAHAVKDGATDKLTDEPATVKVAEPLAGTLTVLVEVLTLIPLSCRSRLLARMAMSNVKSCEC